MLTPPRLHSPRFELPASTTIDPETNKPEMRDNVMYRSAPAGGMMMQQFGRSSSGGGSSGGPRGISVEDGDSRHQAGGIICHKCGEPGHKAPQCPRNQHRGQIVCHNCGVPGHRTPQCPQLRSTGGTRSLDTVLCFKCGQHGHYANNVRRPCSATSTACRCVFAHGYDILRPLTHTLIPTSVRACWWCSVQTRGPLPLCPARRRCRATTADHPCAACTCRTMLGHEGVLIN